MQGLEYKEKQQFSFWFVAIAFGLMNFAENSQVLLFLKGGSNPVRPANVYQYALILNELW